MIGELALLPSRKALRRLDVVAGLTVAVFVALGVLAALELTRLAGLSSGLLDAAAALDQVGQALNTVAGVPVVGPAVGRLAHDVQHTAAQARAGGMQAGSAVRGLAVVIGVAIAVIPLPALLAGYLPLRRARSREVRALRRHLATGDPVEETLIAHLAHGAVSRLPYPRLLQVSGDPWRDLAAGRYRRLAAAELGRLGVTPPRSWLDPAEPTPREPG